MRFRRQLGALTAALLGVGGGLAVPALAAPAAADLYVSPSTCSDTGQGTQALPFCTIQAAAAVVEAGQTVIIAPGVYSGAVTITHSGTPGDPITFKTAAASIDDNSRWTVEQTDASTAATLTLSGVHDVRVNGLNVVQDSGDGIDVEDSSDIVLDADTVGAAVTVTTATPVAGISITDGSSDVSVIASQAMGGSGYDVSVGSGTRQVTIASDLLGNNADSAINATGVSGLDVTGNSVIANHCAAALSISGASSGAVENNALRALPVGSATCAAAPLVSVSADSTGSVTTAYNALAASAPRFDYSWGGTDYATAADLAAAVPGEAGHDLEVAAGDITGVAPQPGSPLINSADSDAPGVSATDVLGNPRASADPSAPNTGGGAEPMDRGALQRQDGLSLTPAYSPASAEGAAPFDFTVTADPTDTWGETLSSTVDFGDGSGTQTVSGGSASHSYAVPGSYWVTTTAADSDGLTVTDTQQVKVGTTEAPQPVLTATPSTTYDQATGNTLLTADTAVFALAADPDAWEIQTETLTFGDGTTSSVPTSVPTDHTYARPGTYNVSVTTTDLIGRTSKASATITVGDEFQPLTPVRSYDSRTKGIDSVPAHGVVQLSLAQLNAASAGVDAADVTTTVTDAKDAGFLAVYPDGTPRPTVSTLDFAVGQTVSNTATAAVGADGLVDFYNGSSGPVDLIVDTFGAQAGAGVDDDTYSAVGPVRVLDTRQGTGAAKAKVQGGGQVVVAVAGANGVPANATAVVLNVATTDTEAGGFLTAYGDGGYRPGTSNSNWTAGETVSNLVVVPVTDGKAVLFNGSAKSVDFVADLVGYYHLYGDASVIVPTSQNRLLDTRNGTGTGGRIAKIGPGQSIKLQFAGVNGVPAAGTAAAELNITVTGDTAAGFISAYPDGTARPTASSVNFQAGQTVANASLMPVGPDGAIDFYNGSGAPVDLVVDSSGYYYSYPA